MLPNKISLKDNILSNVYGCSFSIFIKNFINENNDFNLIITDSSAKTKKIFNELKYLYKDIDILEFPSLEILAYDRFSASNEIHSIRQNTLYKLQNLKKNTILICSINTILQLLPPKKFINENNFKLKKSAKFSIEQYKQKLLSIGYNCVNQVFESGEFSIRGNIIDIYPIGLKPFRIDLINEKIDSIKELNIETQRSNNEVKEIFLIPSHQFNYTDTTYNFTINKLDKYFASNSENLNISKAIKNKEFFSGYEYYLPLFYNNLETIFDYIPKNSNIHLFGKVLESLQEFTQQTKQRYEQLKLDIDRPIFKYDDIFLNIDSFKKEIKSYDINIKWLENKISKSKQLDIIPITDINANYKLAKPFKNLESFLLSKKLKKIIFSTDSLGRSKILLEHLKKIDINATNLENFEQALNSSNKYCLINSPFEESLIINNDLAIITEFDLFPYQAKNNKNNKLDNEEHSTVNLKDLTDLKKGMYVVHIDYGIGQFQGLEILDINDTKDEFLILLYANNAKVYVPVSSFNLISIYNASSDSNISLSKLGSDKWKKDKEKSIKKIVDVAADLLEIHAKRKLREGYGNSLNEKDYLKFCADFPYNETPDQLKAINDVFKDMIVKKSMDRLICGDVGFGKTEIAMRACFLATHNKKQVVILVPTTILAQQHYNNFKERFANTTVNIDVITRSKTPKKQKELFENLENGNIDIIIGTHKLISSEIKFKNLGLLIIDEEHRFGVTQKEKLKSLKSQIDILTMSATPIPRSLSMAFSALRDISIIASAPAKRLSVKTFVKEYSLNIIHEAILRETIRGGQVFYLHNKVETILTKKQFLEENFPQYRIAVAHGKMSEAEIQKVMFDFKQNKYHILLCTTIIETGVDIPNANTIIIENANNLGLAQLHQIRGRVGRSHHQAYAYMLISDENQITKDAKRRLNAIDSTDSLGGGLTIANHDLEIRGSGEILGKEQSGHINSIGLNLYMELLDKAVKNIKNGINLDENNLLECNNVDIQLNIPAILPKEYISDVNTRINIYKRIANANHQQLTDIKIELIDRFGLLPLEVHYLLRVTKIKLYAIELGIKQIKIFTTNGKIEFIQPLKFNPMNLIKTIQKTPKYFRLSKEQNLTITKKMLTAEQRLDFIESFIKNIKEN